MREDDHASILAIAERLLGLLRADGRVFLTNSGTEANEAGFKVTRRTGRTRLVAATGGFHGRTMGALALTAKEAYRKPFEPLPGEVRFVEYGDTDALRDFVVEQLSAHPAVASTRTSLVFQHHAN